MEEFFLVPKTNSKYRSIPTDLYPIDLYPIQIYTLYRTTDLYPIDLYLDCWAAVNFLVAAQIKK
jgi:hypothetical protein